MFEVFFDAIGWLLSFFYGIWPTYGGAIILLTLTVMVIMTPLTLKGTRSMMAMQRLQPEMKKIQERYRDDREKLNEELLKFYRENNINPVGGCLPLLLQMPVFIVLYQVLRGLTLPASTLGIQLGWSSAQLGAGVLPLHMAPETVTDLPFAPAHLDEASDLYQDLAGSTEMSWLGIDLSSSASQALGENFIHALPFLLLIGVVALSGWYQQKQTMARATSAPTDQQKMMGRIMLFFLPAISFGLPAGIVLYFAVSNLYRIGQQSYITRTMFRGDEPPVAEKSVSKEKNAPTKPAKGRQANRGKGGTPGGSGRSGSGGTHKRAEKGGDRSAAKRKKTYTSDPRAKAGRKKSSPPAAQPRPRKKKKRK